MIRAEVVIAVMSLHVREHEAVESEISEWLATGPVDEVRRWSALRHLVLDYQYTLFE